MTAYDTRDGVAFMCDECGEEWKPPRLGHGSEVPDFRECLTQAKDDGWRAIPVPSRSGKTDWQHRCRDCNLIGFRRT